MLKETSLNTKYSILLNFQLLPGLQTITSGQPQTPQEFREQEAEILTVDFATKIPGHSQWTPDVPKLASVSCRGTLAASNARREALGLQAGSGAHNQNLSRKCG